MINGNFDKIRLYEEYKKRKEKIASRFLDFFNRLDGVFIVLTFIVVYLSIYAFVSGFYFAFCCGLVYIQLYFFSYFICYVFRYLRLQLLLGQNTDGKEC